jgi:hypothetical protein
MPRPSKTTSMRLAIMVMASLALALAAAGCDSGPETPPMDQPIDRETAMDVDARLRQGTDDLLNEQQEAQK